MTKGNPTSGRKSSRQSESFLRCNNKYSSLWDYDAVVFSYVVLLFFSKLDAHILRVTLTFGEPPSIYDEVIATKSKIVRSIVQRLFCPGSRFENFIQSTFYFFAP